MTDARRELSRASVRETSGPAKDLVGSTRRAIEDAELAIRRYQGRVNPFSSADDWRFKVERALELSQIVVWVSDRDAKLLREEIDTLVRATRTEVERHRRSRNFVALPREARADLARAALAADEASHWVSLGRLSNAKDRVEEAYRIVGGVDSEVEDLLQRFRDPDKLEMWARWVESTVTQSHHGPVLVVDKRRRLAVLYEKGEACGWFDIDIGRNSLRQKERAGDGATPEGIYLVVRKKGFKETRFHKALLLDYPNAADRARFEQSVRAGRIPGGSRIGGLIEIHGEGGSGTDWTDGCIAVSNSDMDLLFQKLPVGGRVSIVGGYEVKGN